MIVAIITARGGSKRIPKKNIKPFLGKPIISYSIKAAIESGCFNEVMVSTDNEEIANVSKRYGAEVPFYRSAKNSSDHAPSTDVLIEVLDEYKKRGKKFKYFCCIYPTAPFITAEKLKRGLMLLRKTNADSVIPIVRFSCPIQRSLRIDKSGFLKMVWPNNMFKMSQELPLRFHDCGQFYWLKTSSFLKQKRGFAKLTIPMELSELEVQDIDNFEDWEIAEMKYKLLKKINVPNK